MKKIFLLLFSLNSFSFGVFTEGRIGFDGWGKSVDHKIQGDLSGFFIGLNFGARLGLSKDNYSLFLEFNPKQKVEISSANELARVNSLSLNGRYYLNERLFLGPHLGIASFELEKGPNGITFPNNPKSSSFTIGLNGGYKFFQKNNFYLLADALFALGPFDDDGPSTTPAISSIDASPHFKANLILGYEFN